jgi:hypothetical protein
VFLHLLIVLVHTRTSPHYQDCCGESGDTDNVGRISNAFWMTRDQGMKVRDHLSSVFEGAVRSSRSFQNRYDLHLQKSNDYDG